MALNQSKLDHSDYRGLVHLHHQLLFQKGDLVTFRDRNLIETLILHLLLVPIGLDQVQSLVLGRDLGQDLATITMIVAEDDTAVHDIVIDIRLDLVHVLQHILHVISEENSADHALDQCLVQAVPRQDRLLLGLRLPPLPHVIRNQEDHIHAHVLEQDHILEVVQNRNRIQDLCLAAAQVKAERVEAGVGVEVEAVAILQEEAYSHLNATPPLK